MSPGALRALRFSVIAMGIAILVLATVFALQLWRVVREAGSSGPAVRSEAAAQGPVVGMLEPGDLGLAPGSRILSVAAVAKGQVVLLVEGQGGRQSLLLVEVGAFKAYSTEE